jgi:sec-independent protein translocase protein TatC
VRHPTTQRSESNDGEIPFLDRLAELRWRIIYAVVSTIACIAIGLLVTVKFDLVDLLAKPLIAIVPGRALFFTRPADKLGLMVGMATIIGAVFATPMVLYQFWEFIRQGLRLRGRRVALAVVYAALLLFVAGAAFANFVVVPLALRSLLGLETKPLVPLITASEYFSLVAPVTATFGWVVELPLVILALSALGIVTPQFLARYRRHAAVLIVVTGAFLTPGDMVWTTITFSIPIYALYELSILASRVLARRRERANQILRPTITTA